MSIPSKKDVIIPLLRLIHISGGQIRRADTYSKLADYFRLTKEEQQEMQPSGIRRKFDSRIDTTRNFLCSEGYLDGSNKGFWRITEKGTKELHRLGLIAKPLQSYEYIQKSSLNSSIDAGEIIPDDELLDCILEEIAPNGIMDFPDGFLENKDCLKFYEIELPGTQLELAPLSKTLIISTKKYFHYQAKNPPEAKYIIYAHNIGCKSLRIPSDNLILFKIVVNYEKYCDEITRKAFELFREYTYDEDKSEKLTKEVVRKLNLKANKYQD